uniref:Uncharacterized protein n=1 Tax=viral metagenome TaxID=1070528 RepID=A0A6M3JNL7_9ZZZZ
MAEKELCALCRTNSESDVVHICGFCAQMMLEADQEYLKRMYELAKSKNSMDQMWAINCFINKEGVDGSSGKKPGRGESIKRVFNRTGSSRFARSIERPVR